MAKEGALRTEIWVDGDIEKVFEFFSDARNLELITPTWLKFEITSPTPIEMKVGTLIDYRLKVRGFPLKWRTLISAWEPPHRFVDEQIKGPYRQWIHEHTFESKDGGTRVIDHVRYKAPFHFISDPLLVRRDVEKIFSFRTECLKSKDWRQ